jgi:hypothetical protein
MSLTSAIILSLKPFLLINILRQVVLPKQRPPLTAIVDNKGIVPHRFRQLIYFWPQLPPELTPLQ